MVIRESSNQQKKADYAPHVHKLTTGIKREENEEKKRINAKINKRQDQYNTPTRKEERKKEEKRKSSQKAINRKENQ